ncbi:MAG: PspA-associated protein PspAA [Solirubrobacteraceae bacterium]
MIVRIATEGQYEVADGELGALNELDNEAVAACEDDDEERFHEAFTRLLDFVRTRGAPVDADHLGGSDLILPPPDVSLKEARSEFSGEGLIPG